MKLIAQDNSLKIVVVENFFQNWNTPHLPDLFKNVVGLKHGGYGGFYATGFLPVDTSDFICTHHLICKETASGLTPIAGFKSITLEQCNTYRLIYPSVNITNKCPEAAIHRIAVQEIIQAANQSNKTLSYGSSWTIHPDVRGDRETVEFLKDMARAMLAHYQLENNIDEEMCCGLIKAKTDVYFGELGYAPVTLRGEVLPTFSDTNLDGKTVRLLHRTQFTPFALEAAKRHQHAWNNRIVIDQPAQDNFKKTAA